MTRLKLALGTGTGVVRSTVRWTEPGFSSRLDRYDTESYTYDMSSYRSGTVPHDVLGPTSAITNMSSSPLAPAELSVVELLWQHGALTARQIQDAIYGESDRSQHGTVQRLLQRLEDKGIVQRDRNAPVHTFTASIGREAYAASQLETLAGRLTGGSLAPLLTHLIENKRLDRAELRRLRQILDGGKAAGGKS